MVEPEDMSRFVQEGRIDLAADALTKLFMDGPKITLTGTFNDRPPTQQERIRSYYIGWARAHRN